MLNVPLQVFAQHSIELVNCQCGKFSHEKFIVLDVVTLSRWIRFEVGRRRFDAAPHLQVTANNFHKTLIYARDLHGDS